MRQFVKSVVPTEGYEEVKKVGSKYVVHLEGVPSGEADGTTACWETMTDGEPDMAALTEELQAWKAHVAELELTSAISSKQREILSYDSSPSVNSFEIRRNGEKMMDYWIGRDLRTSLEGDVLAASAIGDTYKFDIREMGISLELNCTKFLAALTHLRQYAYQAFNVTSHHLANVSQLTTVEAVQGYDYTVGYPAKLVFNLEELT